MYLLPVSTNDVWKWNLHQIKKREHLFDGKKVLTIASHEFGRIKRGRRRKHLKIAPTNSVYDFMGEIDLRFDEVLVVQNDAARRETAAFPEMLRKVKSLDPDEVTFCCHGKGVSYGSGSVVVEWGDVMYHTCLDSWPVVKNALECFAFAGAFRRFGMFTTPGNHKWHYSGTFYWFRHDEVFSLPDYDRLDQQFFGTESWPGKLFPAERCACIFCDNAPDLYVPGNWEKIVRPQLRQWNEVNDMHITEVTYP
jgi:hypothetical protein